MLKVDKRKLNKYKNKIDKDTKVIFWVGIANCLFWDGLAFISLIIFKKIDIAILFSILGIQGPIFVIGIGGKIIYNKLYYIYHKLKWYKNKRKKQNGKLSIYKNLAQNGQLSLRGNNAIS